MVFIDPVEKLVIHDASDSAVCGAVRFNPESPVVVTPIACPTIAEDDGAVVAAA